MKVHTIFTTIIIGASLMSANASAESLCSSERSNKDEKHTTVQSEKEKNQKRIPIISKLEVYEHKH